jgi:hypothetical protein
VFLRNGRRVGFGGALLGHVLVMGLTVLVAQGAASAFVDDLGSRSLAMGGAGRADARGDEAPLLNPSGMSLARFYTIQGHYQLTNPGGGQVVHASVVDSTSSFNLSGGAYYTYRTASVNGFPRSTGHEAGVLVSAPFGDRVMLGVTGKYLQLAGGAPAPDGAARHSGLTLDAGITIRPVAALTLGVVGYNLHDLSTSLAPTSLGYGAAVNVVPELIIAADLFHDFTTWDATRGVRTTVAAGVDYTWAQSTAFRAGVGHDGSRDHGYVSAGFAAMSDIGAVDLSLRQDITGTGKVTTFIASLRLFVTPP